MLRYVLAILLASAAFAAESTYQLSGRIVPRGRASVSLFGATLPFSASAIVFSGDAFHFKKLRQGTYTLVIFMRSRGEARKTVEVGPGTADQHGRVSLHLDLQDSDFVFDSALRRHTVSANELRIPEASWRDFRDAQEDLKKHRVDAAEARLERAVDRTPQFSAAWNNLGTIAYQGTRYARAQECFREALAEDPQSFEALVNLGGVLITLRKLDEALTRNSMAAQTRPNDALAQSQLGMTYFLLGQFELAKKHLSLASSLDPSHFSHPQLILAEIDFQQGNRRAAADALEDFLKYHPDYPQAADMRLKIADLRSR